MSAPVLLLGRREIETLAADGLCVRAVEEALVLHAQRRFVQPLKPYLRWRDGGHIADRIIAMPAYLGGDRPAAGLKWIGSKHDNPASRGLERASALIILNDVETHHPVAVLEGAWISAARTAAVSVIATQHLARAGFTDVACIGCGPIARTHLELMLDRFPSIARIHLFDLDAAAAGRLADHVARPAIEVIVAASAERAVRAGEVVLTCTVADRPYIPFEWLGPGAFVSNVSIMDLEEEVFVRADKVVVDDWDQCNREKKVIHRLVEAGRFSRERLHAELGEIVAGARPGRERDDEIIVLNPMGIAIEDVACARAIVDAARREGVGTWWDLA